MRVFLLGGTGRIGRAVARVLAQDDEIHEIAIAARDRTVANRVSGEVGPKAVAFIADALDEVGLATQVKSYDLFVNVAGPDFRVALPAIRAAIAAKTNYCDIAADASSTEKALSLDEIAKDADVTALTGIGHVPGESNLLMCHAADQLEVADTVRCCVSWAFNRDTYKAMGDPDEMRSSGRVSASWQTIVSWVAGRVRAYRESRWIEVDPFGQAASLIFPNGAVASACPIASSESISFPRFRPRVRTVEILLSLDPPQLMRLLGDQAQSVAAGKVDASEAAMTFLETITKDPDRWFGGPREVPPGFGLVVSAQGSKDGRRVRYSCWPATAWESTVGPLTVASRMILRGEIRERGVFPPEAVLDPISFLKEASGYGKEPPGFGPLLCERLEALD